MKFSLNSILRFSTVGLMAIGGMLVFRGCWSEFRELILEGSAVRQTVSAVQYGTGFLILILGVIAAALLREQ